MNNAGKRKTFWKSIRIEVSQAFHQTESVQRVEITAHRENTPKMETLSHHLTHKCRKTNAASQT